MHFCKELGHPAQSRRWNWICLLLFVIGQFASSLLAQTISPRDRYGEVKRWRLTYRYTADSPYSWKDGPINRDRTRWRASEQGTIIIMMDRDGSDHLKGEGEGRVEASIDRYFVEHTQYFSDSRYDRGNGTANSRALLHFDFTTNTYEVSISAGTIPSTYGGRRMQVGSGITEWGPTNGDTHTPIPLAVAPWGAQKFPESGQTINGSWTWEEQLARMEATDSNFDRHEWSKREPTQGKLTWILEPDDPVDEELVVEVDDHDNWLPVGGANEDTTGNKVGLKATVVSKSGGAPQHLAVMFRLAFEEVSREPGVALNHPLVGAKNTPDLLFEAAENGDGWIVSPDGLGMQKVGTRMTSASGKVSSRDWGAYGIVHVWATLENGKVLRGKLRGSESVDVRLPQGSAVSQIGEAWKRRTQFSGGDTDDLDEQTGNPNEGDGLTAYEEYRGLIIDSVHTRNTDLLAVKRKDLIVANDIAATGRAGLALFERASGIHVVELKPAELPASRMVNVNRGTASRGEQYGLLLKKGSLGGTAGENRPAALLGKTPKMSQEVVIDVDDAPTFFAAQSAAARAAGETMPYTQEQYMNNTIAHEIAHGVRTPHHGKTTAYFGPREVTVRMRDYRAFGSDGKPLTATEGSPIPLAGPIGRPGNDGSGDTSCIMTYTNFYAWAAIGPAGGPYRFYKLGLQPVGEIFCTGPRATGYNVSHRVGAVSVPGFFGNAESQGGDAPAGNCLGAMRVRDW